MTVDEKIKSMIKRSIEDYDNRREEYAKKMAEEIKDMWKELQRVRIELYSFDEKIKAIDKNQAKINRKHSNEL